MGNAAIALQLLMGLLDRASQVGMLINAAQAQGRDITKEELDGLAAKDDVARAKLQDAISRAQE
jgi:RNA:NAD 2'-phosphotransferase (TPT1/KptA family)